MLMILYDEKPDKPPVRKLIVRPKQRILFLKELRRMNITAASLFPDVVGFTRSLVEELEIQMLLDWQKTTERESHDLQLLHTYLQNHEREQDP
jgi:hypothetical protein